ncbi:hypothetical protein ACRAWD_14960 [Caulobacter segnis]
MERRPPARGLVPAYEHRRPLAVRPDLRDRPPPYPGWRDAAGDGRAPGRDRHRRAGGQARSRCARPWAGWSRTAC